MSKILVVYHSLSGNTEKMAKALAEGASGVSGTEVVLKRALDASLQDLLECDAIAFGSVDYFSYIAGALKDFFDRTYYPSKDQVAGKPYASFAIGGRGGDTALAVLDRICGSFKLEKAVDSVSVVGAPSSQNLAKCKEAGEKLAKAVLK
jgi:multimeric flavodoxin WrbA